MKCGVCKGRKTLYAGNGVNVPCTGCKGQGSVTATLAEREAAKRAAVDRETKAALAPKILRIVVPGEPVPKGRPRFAVQKGRAGKAWVRTYTPEETEAYEKKVRGIAELAVAGVRWVWSKNDRFNVVMRVWRTHFDAGGDLDNLIKCCDALNGLVWTDDRHVRGIGAAFQAPDPLNPRVEIEVRRFPVEKP